MQTEQMDGAEKALAKEFSDYLASVSREIVNPIEANVVRHQADVERMLSKIADARAQVEADFGKQRKFLDLAREQVEQIVKESEAKLERMHSSRQLLLDTSQQHILAELKAVSDDAGTTAQLIAVLNEDTRRAIAEHHESLQKLVNENKDGTAQIVAEAKGTLDATFTAHRKSLDEATYRLLFELGTIADDLKLSMGSLVAEHEETRLQLLEDFSKYRTAAEKQIAACQESLSKEISEQIDRRARDAIETIGNGITDRYKEQFAALKSAVAERFEATGHEQVKQTIRIEATITKAVFDTAGSLAEGHAKLIRKLQKEISTLRNMAICLIVGVAGLAAFELANRF